MPVRYSSPLHDPPANLPGARALNSLRTWWHESRSSKPTLRRLPVSAGSEVPDARPRNQYVATVTPRVAALARGDVEPVGRETRDRIVTGAATVVPLLALGVVGSRIARERQASAILSGPRERFEHLGG